MAFDDRRIGSTSATRIGSDGLAPFTKKITIDCAANDVTSGDVVKVLYIPAGFWILGAGADVETAEGGTLTFDVGLYAAANDAETDLDGFLDGVDGNAVGTKLTSSEAYAATGGYRCAAAQNLCVKFNNAADAAKIHIFVTLVDYTS